MEYLIVTYVRLNPNLTTNKILQKLTLNLLQIWGAAAGVSPGPSDLVWKSQMSWGAGDSIGVTLITDDGEVSEIVNSFYSPNTETCLMCLILEGSWWQVNCILGTCREEDNACTQSRRKQ